jgi:hypothetical protein
MSHEPEDGGLPLPSRGECPDRERPELWRDSAGPSGVVKKSRTGICHAPGTTYYAQTLNFISYESIEACLASGGRLPKG